MAARLSGLREAVRQAQNVVNNVIAIKSVRAIKRATYIIRTESASMTPIDTSTLINSQFDTVEVKGVRITGRIGYSAKYALYVHNASGKLKGKPRVNGHGNYWNPHAEPQFLSKAIEKTKSLVDNAIKDEMKL